MHVCLYVLCGHLLGKGWPLGSHLWCLTVSFSLSHWYPGSGVVLECIDSWSLHPYLLWFNALIFAQLCDGCWCRLTTAFAVSHKRYTNRHLNQHMIHVLRYCDEAQASLCKFANSPEPSLHASIWNIDTYCIVLCKCADSTESKLLAWIAHKSPFEPAHGISLLWRGSGEPGKMCRLARAFAACQHMKYWYLLHCPVTIPVQMCRIIRV